MQTQPYKQHIKITHLLKHLCGLRVEGIEKSFKMIPNTLLENRFIIGINHLSQNKRKILNCCQELNMPENCIKSFEEHFSKANLVYFGIEEHSKHFVYKVYLEFWSRFIDKSANNSDKNQPFVLHIGYKWNADNNTQNTIARYTLYPDLTQDKILHRIKNMYQNSSDAQAYEIAEEIILAAAKNEKCSFKYLEVEEENNPRKSYDINVYEAELLIKDIHCELRKAQVHYNIPNNLFDKFYSQIQNKILGHLSGGIDKTGKDFMTVYYEVENL